MFLSWNNCFLKQIVICLYFTLEVLFHILSENTHPESKSGPEDKCLFLYSVFFFFNLFCLFNYFFFFASFRTMTFCEPPLLKALSRFTVKY